MINGFDALKNRQQSKQQRFSSGEGHSSVLRTVVLFKVFFWNLMVLNEENRTQVWKMHENCSCNKSIINSLFMTGLPSGEFLFALINLKDHFYISNLVCSVLLCIGNSQKWIGKEIYKIMKRSCKSGITQKRSKVPWNSISCAASTYASFAYETFQGWSHIKVCEFLLLAISSQGTTRVPTAAFLRNFSSHVGIH